MLNNIESISKIDKSGMLDDVAGFPKQILKSKEIINQSNLPNLYKIDNIIICGMGGSAISGDIVQSLFRERIDIPIFVSRQYDLPRWAHKNTLVITQSYSGNTEETLSTFKHASQKHCKIIGISSGGKLKEYCEKRQIPHIKIPENIQPRAATGYILFSSIYALQKMGVLTHNMESEIKETIDITHDFSEHNKKEIPENENLSKQIAKKIFGTIPQVYGWNHYSPIAKRWCTQFNENSKVICRYDEVSECNHNDIVGWSRNPEVSKKFTCIMIRNHEDESIYMTTRLNFMKKLYQDVASQVIEIQVKGKKRLAKMMYLMYFGDFISCYLAILRNVDPSSVEAIDELKDLLAKI